MQHAVTRDFRVIALEHDVADGTRRAGSPGDERDEPVARDAAARDVAHDSEHVRSPGLGHASHSRPDCAPEGGLPADR